MTEIPESVVLSEEDAKLVTLARGARARISAKEGAAVRDETGRTYSAANISLKSLKLSALQLAVAQAVASGAKGCECAVVITTDGLLDEPGLKTVRDLGDERTVVITATPRVTITSREVLG